MQGIIKTRAGQAKAPYTILLVGETGVGKSSLLELIANVLHGKGVDHYDFDTLDHTNEQGGSSNQSQTNSAGLYEFKSKNGVVVCNNVCYYNMMSTLTLLLRSASSIHRDWPILAVSNKMRSTRKASRISSRSTSTPSLPFSSSPMALSRALLSAPITCYLLCPPCSPNHSQRIFPSCSPTYRVRFIGTSARTLSRRCSKMRLNSASTTPSRFVGSTSSSEIIQIRRN